ncbi:hypothetical protein C8R43DRAFT_1240426 [Mycena crocata]|nr:hypothetical protein C8R43DRAFT_1240426 [Mycena crocata]
MFPNTTSWNTDPQLGDIQRSLQNNLNRAVAEASDGVGRRFSELEVENRSLKEEIIAASDAAMRQNDLLHTQHQAETQAFKQEIIRLRTEMGILEAANRQMHERAQAFERSVKERDAVHRQALLALLLRLPR